ncbi:uncharacterized protein PV09_05797 [Verruconis gallopava]|uniref:DUF6536 domain-containing protein n=1 Tax=Verruconis gallopava TaxID=253628 RepID=A0A0D2AVI8_9PEZI|nr:uncharacterized protein PV09_05797 [Verruconis gallopava]KIW03154.1 hypothetical protein PV09_05797 [Verruconis gallopava]
MLRLKRAPYRQVSSDIELHELWSSTAVSRLPTTASWTKRHFKGWRFGVISGAWLAICVLVLNVAITFSALQKQHAEDSGRRVLFEGDCRKAETLNVVAHLLINAMSTLLLSASNYGMQILTAPTRSEIDFAHAKKKWLDIGVLSLKNIRTISRSRALLWATLGASSLPLHLMYNSAVFSTVNAHEYSIYTARPDMLTNTAANKNSPLGYAQTDARYTTVKQLYEKAMNSSLDKLSASQCIDAYAMNFQTERGDVILVTNDQGPLPVRDYNNFESTINRGSMQCKSNPFDWICGEYFASSCFGGDTDVCSVAYKNIDGDNWSPLGNKVEYCLSEKLSGHCKVQFSVVIAWVVLAFNLCKAIALLLIFFFLSDDPLVTMGDAVSSFLRVSDETTRSRCLMSHDRLALWTMPPEPQPYSVSIKKNSRRWSNVVSKRRWWFCMALYFAAIGACLFLFLYGIFGHPLPSRILIALPIGSLNPATFIYGWTLPSSGALGLISNVIIANLPQVVLSMIYYTYNSLFTCFLAGREWSRYATHKKGLRISSIPRGAQRSTYTLQLPYRVALPLMTLSGILHWLTSQSIFLVSVQEQSQDGLSDEFLTCGYSPSAILGVITLGSVMVAMVWYLGTRTYRGGMPIVATNSACISAMCHVSEEEREADIAFLPVRWGIPDHRMEDDDRKDSVRHCTFSSLYVRMPKEGELCAGVNSADSHN